MLIVIDEEEDNNNYYYNYCHFYDAKGPSFA